MKIQQSDIRRFLPFTHKLWKSSIEGEPQVVFLTFMESSYSIAMIKGGLMLTYLCNRVDSETSEQVMAFPFELLSDFSMGSGIVELREVIENGESYVEAKCNDGPVQYTKKVRAQEPLEDHLVPDLAWHTVDERLIRSLRPSAKLTRREETTIDRLRQCGLARIIEASNTATH